MPRSCLILFLALSGCIPSSRFENDVEGWTLSGNGADTEAKLLASGGYPNGNICGQDSYEQDAWYFVAPPKFRGNHASAYGLRLTFDLKQKTYIYQVKGRDVVLEGNSLRITNHFRFTPGIDWTPYSIRLDDASGWVYDERTTNAGDPVTADDFRSILRDVTVLKIRGEFVDGPNDEACLDNVYFGRE
ncbi:MAG: laminin B domain-containing protein [Myxococcota bacterium]